MNKNIKAMTQFFIHSSSTPGEQYFLRIYLESGLPHSENNIDILLKCETFWDKLGQRQCRLHLDLSI